MEVQVLEYIQDIKGFRKGFVDIKVIYTPEKYEIFRGLQYFEKEERKWLNFPNIRRDDDWKPYYERSPAISKDMLIMALSAVEEHVKILKDKPIEDSSSEFLF